MTPLSIHDFPLHGARLIEASAGTGKTFTLAALYVRLVLGHGEQGNHFQRALSPSDILVITFTKAATAELRDRIRARLVQTAQVFRALPEVTPDPFQQQLVADYPAHQHAHCAAVLDLAAQSMDEAAIFTIHGWCQRMLGEHAFYSGLSFNEAVSEDEQALQLQVAQDYWRVFLYPLPSHAATQRLLSIATDPASLFQQVSLLLVPDPPQSHYKGATLPEPQPPAHTLQKLIDQLDEANRLLNQIRAMNWTEALDTIEQAIAQKGLSGTWYRQNWWNTDRAILTAMFQDAQADTLTTKEALTKLEKYGFQSLNREKCKAPPQHPVFRHIDELHTALATISDPAPALLAHACDWIGNTLQRRRRELAELTFNDMLTRLRNALDAEGGEALINCIREQFPVAMVDEFQDTDPTQFSILQALYPDTNSQDYALILVGDPKQAIYSFRGADLYTYLQAREQTTGRHYQLDTNYRSTAAMVDAVNALFGQAEKNLPDGAFGFAQADQSTVNPIPFHSVAAQGKQVSLHWPGNETHAMQVLLECTPVEQLTKSQFEATMAERCATEIESLLGAAGWRNNEGHCQPLQANDLAVLVRNQREANRIQTALAKRGLRSVYLSDRDSVFNSAEAKLVLAWLTAVHLPDDEQQLRNALALPLSQCSDAELLDYLENEQDWEALTDCVREWQSVWRRQGVLPMLRDWLHHLNLPGRWLALPHGERTLTNVLHLAELLQQHSQRVDGEAGLLRWLNQHILKPPSHEAAILRLESDAELIQVVTIHKSKGLQYPLVFLPFALGSRELKTGQKLQFYQNDRRVIDLSANDQSVALAQREQLLEETRLLYVALTRAVHACWIGLGAYRTGNGKQSRLGASALGRLLGLTDGATTKDLINVCQHHEWLVVPERAPGTPKNVSSAMSHRALRLDQPLNTEHWWIASYSALQTGGRLGTPDTPHEEQQQEEGFTDFPDDFYEDPKGIHRFPKGSHAGTFLHDLLEYACPHRFTLLNLQDILQPRLRVRGWEAFADTLIDWWQQLIDAPLPGNACLSHLSSTWAEMEFWLEAPQINAMDLDRLVQANLWPSLPRPALVPDTLNGLLKGFIDLVYQAPDGRYWVIDYKSNWLGNDDDAYHTGACQKTMLSKRYDVQGALYGLALHRLLQLRQPDYGETPERYFGGVAFWFIRSPMHGVQRLPTTLAFIQSLDRLFTDGSTYAA